jgi:hypothetical protein
MKFGLVSHRVHSYLGEDGVASAKFGEINWIQNSLHSTVRVFNLLDSLH